MRLRAGVGAVLLAGLVVMIAQISPSSATNTTLYPTSMTVESGAVSGNVAGLQAVDGVAVHLGPNASKSYRSYQLGTGVVPSTIWSLGVGTVYRGPLKTSQVVSWYLRDFTTSKWVKLGDNYEIAVTSQWTTLHFYPAGGFARFVSSTGALQVRSVAANKPLVADVDAEWIDVAYGAKPAAPGWTPTVGTRWQYQLQPPVDTSITAVPWTGGAAVAPQVFDIDLYESDGITPAASTVAAIHANGARAVCYIDAGTWENWRPDAASYPATVLGHGNGWPGEKWVDIRRLDVLVPIVSARVQRCVDAGFDAVEFDNMDAYSNGSGFRVSAGQQVDFNRAMAAVAHSHGMSVGLKNDVAQLTQLEPWFEFAINEQCQQYSECGGYDAWTSTGKAVAQVEYTSPLGTFCPPAIAAGRSAIRKDLALLATPYTPCT